MRRRVIDIVVFPAKFDQNILKQQKSVCSLLYRKCFEIFQFTSIYIAIANHLAPLCITMSDNSITSFLIQSLRLGSHT